jgi:hypothetical protein
MTMEDDPINSDVKKARRDGVAIVNGTEDRLIPFLPINVSWRHPMTMRDGDPRIIGPGNQWFRLPVAAAAIAILALFAMVYDFGNQRSHSEKYGTVTETEAADGVMPSLAPDAGMETSETRESPASLP